MKVLTLLLGIFISSYTRAEIVIVDTLNLRENKLQEIIATAKDKLPYAQSAVSIRAYRHKYADRAREAVVTFEPYEVTENSFSTRTVVCRKSARRWLCNKPIEENFYYRNGSLSHSISLGPGVTPQVAEDIIDYSEGTPHSINLGGKNEHLDFGSNSSITLHDDSDYYVIGRCNCLFRVFEKSVLFIRSVDVLE